MSKWNDPHFWMTLLKLIIGGAIVIGLVMLALWYSTQYYSAEPPKQESQGVDWGVAGDSPLKRYR